MSKYSKELLEPIVKSSESIREIGRKVGIKSHGGSLAYLKKRIISLGIDISHLKGRCWTRNKILPNRRRSPSDILKKDSFARHALLKRALLENNIQEVCKECKIGTTWNNKKLVLEIDHIDGDNTNNLIENLRFLCSNCHSQTETWKNRKRKPIGDGTRLEPGRG